MPSRRATTSLAKKASAVADALGGAFDGGAFDGTAGVCCSGGADSVALALWAFARGNGRIALVHFNHGTRGRASDADAAFVRGLARRLGVPFYGKKARGLVGASETALRAARYEFFRATARAKRLKTLLLAHHADDAAETLFLRLSRGSGCLAAPRPVRREGALAFVRPFLELPKSALVAALSAAGVSWREDATNKQADCARNALRLRALPALRRAFAPRDFDAGVRRARRWLAQDDEALEIWLREKLGAEFETRATLDMSALRGAPAALFRRALRAWLDVRDAAGHLNARAFDAALAAALRGAPFRASAGKDAFLVGDGVRLRLECARAAVAAQWDISVLKPRLVLPTGAQLRAEPVRLSARLREKIFAGDFSPDSVVYVAAARAELAVCSPRAGLRLRLLGATGRTKLSDALCAKKIPLSERKSLPVVYNKKTGAIVWVPRLPPADAVRLDARAVRALRLTYHAASEKIIS